MLDVDPNQRVKGGYGRLKSDPFFADFDWDALMENELTPPY